MSFAQSPPHLVMDAVTTASSSPPPTYFSQDFAKYPPAHLDNRVEQDNDDLLDDVEHEDQLRRRALQYRRSLGGGQRSMDLDKSTLLARRNSSLTGGAFPLLVAGDMQGNFCNAQLALSAPATPSAAAAAELCKNTQLLEYLKKNACFYNASGFEEDGDSSTSSIGSINDVVDFVTSAPPNLPLPPLPLHQLRASLTEEEFDSIPRIDSTALLKCIWFKGSKIVFPDVQYAQAMLLKQEDTDGDKKITKDDFGPKMFPVHLEGSRPGNPKYALICGTYNLSVLLQELTLAMDQGIYHDFVLDPAMFAENPVDRLNRMIKDVFWKNLIRSVDEAVPLRLLQESSHSPMPTIPQQKNS